MNLLACQWDIVWEDKRANFEKVQRLLAAAAPPAGALVVLPELFATGFSMNVAGMAETPGGETEQFLGRTAKALGVYLVGGVALATANSSGRNEAVCFSPHGRVLARYAKMHPFTYGGESQHYEAGDRPVLFPWHDCRVAPFICYDLRFPEGFRAAVAEGAELFVVLANWPSARAYHWMTLLQARAIENQAYVLGVNRCGRDPKHAYDGHSMMVDPQGQIVARAGTEEQVIGAELDLRSLRGYRRQFPALADMRPQGATGEAG
jgi:predicted amidohydrolase